jgi:hypothetical protein
MPAMRTTLTIDDDLARLLKWRARDLGLPFKDVVNRTLRAGLGEQAKPHREAPKVLSHSFGFRPGTDLDKLNRLADELEAETYAAGQQVDPKQRPMTRHDPARRKRPRSRP